MTPARAIACLSLLVGLLTPARADDTPAADAVAELYKSGKLFDKTQYKAVRTAFAEEFERRHASELHAAFGADFADLTAWLKDQAELREDLYTALDERYDKVGNALKLFHDLWKESPDQVKKFPSLAIAIAVVWDNPRGVYDYRGHQVRTKSTLPEGQVGALENFRFFAEGPAVLQERARLLPREFLAYLVDHRTPLSERKWALDHYGAQRPMVGRCFGEIAYDHDLLKGLTPHLAGHEYSLEDIRRYGGVCAMQADYAARVGKSVGVPAAYVHGPGNTLGMHAWVMWVELKQVRKDATLFSLESHGRYDLDRYYTGTLIEPQTGQVILDRDMELRLTVAGRDRTGKRQAEMVMRAYPGLKDKLSLDTAKCLSYLDRTLRVSPYDEAAWLELARMAKAGEAKGPQRQALLGHMETLLHTFSKFPDFTWKVFEDLLLALPEDSQRARMFEKLVALYEQAGRPDLACEARFKLADIQVSQKRYKHAAEGLAFTIRKFPSEGRYVPRLMEKLQEVCKNYQGGTELLGKFYLDVLPAIPAKRGGDPSAYCIKMYEQAVAFFKENQKDKVAAQLKSQLARIRRGDKQ
jgi:hypothetical protein